MVRGWAAEATGAGKRWYERWEWWELYAESADEAAIYAAGTVQSTSWSAAEVWECTVYVNAALFWFVLVCVCLIDVHGLRSDWIGHWRSKYLGITGHFMGWHSAFFVQHRLYGLWAKVGDDRKT